MLLITNFIFTDIEKAYLEFVLSYDFPEKSDVIEQLNHMTEDDITRDVTPFCWIMEFRPNGINPGYGPMDPCVDIEVRHNNGSAQTAFTLFLRNGVVFELEIYNVDSSAMDLNGIMDGQRLLRSGN